jgi:two-component system chemotaxis response regulator CheY
MKALVVDDDLMTRIILQEILSSYADVHTCEDGDEAVQVYKQALERGERYDLICMDVLMPKMNGIEALGLIRQEERASAIGRQQDTKVIITTATDDIDTIRQAFRGLCDAYIVKPIESEELIDIVHCLFPLDEPCT